MLCVSLFITKCFQIVQNKNNFHKDRDVSSKLYFIPFNLKIRPLYSDFFSSVMWKGLCEGLLTKRFTTTRNLACKRERMFLSIFTSTPVIQCLSHSAVKLLLAKFIFYKNHSSKEQPSWSKHKIWTHMWYWLRWVCWKHRNQTRMKVMMRKNNHHHHSNENTLGSKDCSLRLTRHMSINLQAVTKEAERSATHK